jgi:multiple sugar transport system permease protein
LGRAGATGFVAPALGLIGVFLIFPALWTIYLGLTDYRLFGIQAAEPQFVGTQNFTQTISDPQFANALKVTLIFVLGSALIGQMVLGFLLAWRFHGWTSVLRKVVESLVIVAWIIPSSVVAFLWIAFLDGESGTLNHLFGLHVDWLIHHPLLSIIVFNTWRGTAFSMLLFGAALNNVPPSHLETSRIAGASGWQQLRDIVLPSIRGHILTNMLLISLWTFNDFGPYLITAGGPNFATELLPIYVYRNAFSYGALGLGAAISTIMLAINLVLALVYLRLLRERKTA